VSIGNRKVNIPGYLVRAGEESQILLHIEIPAAAASGEQPAAS
jgi:ribosomal protein S4